MPTTHAYMVVQCNRTIVGYNITSFLCAVCLDAPSVPILRATFSPADKRKPATILPTSPAMRHADARPRLGGLGRTFESHLSHHSYIGNSVNTVNFDSSSAKENSGDICLVQ